MAKKSVDVAAPLGPPKNMHIGATDNVVAPVMPQRRTTPGALRRDTVRRWLGIREPDPDTTGRTDFLRRQDKDMAKAAKRRTTA